MIYWFSKKILFLLPLISLLLDCSFTTLHNVNSCKNSLQWQMHKQNLSKITKYQTRGIFVYFSEHKKFLARFNWKQTKVSCYHLLLTNLLGSTILHLAVQGSNLQIIDNKGNQYTDNDSKNIVLQIIGADVPIINLSQWIIGLPGDNTTYQLNNHCQLKSLLYKHNDQYWKVSILNYDSFNHIKNTLAMPINLELTNGNQRIKLRMDNWSFQ